MKLPSLPVLWRTTPVRLALRYLILYTSILGVVIAALFWWTRHSLTAQVAEGLQAELAAVVNTCPDGGPSCVKQVLSTAPRADERLFIFRFGKEHFGDLSGWPENLSSDDEVRVVFVEEELLPGELFDDDAHLPGVAHRFPDGTEIFFARLVEQARELNELSEYLVESFALAILLALALGISVGRSVLRRVDEVRGVADEIMRGDLSRRVPLSGRNDEFDALASQLNAMLARTEQLICGLREVADNIAHDLRSPLSRLRSQLEVALLEERSGAEYRHVLQRGVEEISSLIRTFNALLEISQVEAGGHRTEWQTFNLALLAADLVEFYRAVAEEQRQELLLEAGGELNLRGIRLLIAEAMSNLLENALKFTPPGGRISLSLSASPREIELSVTDSGPGIPLHERSRVLDRFVRLESARSTPGSGLGLSLVRAVVQLHGAVLALESADPGLRVRIRFPVPSTKSGSSRSE